MTCNNCQIEMVKFGFHKGYQRFRCQECGKTKTEMPQGPLDAMRTAPGKAYQVVSLLAEGVGIRASERLTGLNRRTVLAVLQVAGQKCLRLLDYKVQNIAPKFVEVDELWSFCRCKQINARPFSDDGDQYVFLASDRETKLIISHVVGKRTHENTFWFLRDLRQRTVNRFQLSTDGFDGYTGQGRAPGQVARVFGNAIDFGTEIKSYGHDPEGQRRYSAPPLTGIRRRCRLGNPNPRMVTTSHAERANLSVRLFNRRFTRLTLGYSKKIENHRHAVALFVAHFNFCRVHSSIKATPAMAAGLADHVWTVEELLKGTL